MHMGVILCFLQSTCKPNINTYIYFLNNGLQQKSIRMSKQVPFGNRQRFLASIIITLIIWGATVETRFGKVIENTNDIRTLEMYSKDSEKTIQKYHVEVMDQLHNIELQLKDKKDRE